MPYWGMHNDSGTGKLPFDRRSSLTLRAVIGLCMMIGATAFAVGLILGSHVASGAGEGSQPQGVDFGPVWKAWHVIDEKFVPAAVATTTPVASSTAQADQQ